MAINNFKCEKCGRNMGDIDEPICHQCEQYELDVELERLKTKRAKEADEAEDQENAATEEREQDARIRQTGRR